MTNSINSLMPDTLASLDDETRNAFMDEMRGRVQAVLSVHGPRGFRSERKDAAAHEAAHAVHYAATGEFVESVRVEPMMPPEPFFAQIGVFWGGLTKAGKGWELSPDTAPQADLINARNLIAGRVGELMLRGKKFAPGSSLDERALSKVLCACAARKLGVDPMRLFDDQILAVRGILFANNKAYRALAHELISVKKVSGPHLAALLDPVKRIPALPPEAVADDEW